MSKSVAENITEARDDAELSKAELARRIGVARSLITEYEGGTRKPTEENLKKIADACGVEVADLTKVADVGVAG